METDKMILIKDMQLRQTHSVLNEAHFVNLMEKWTGKITISQKKKARNVHCREVKGKMFWFFTFFCYFHNKEDTYIDRVRVMVEALRHFSTPTMR